MREELRVGGDDGLREVGYADREALGREVEGRRMPV